MCISLVLVLFVTCLEVRSYSVAQAKLELELDIPLPHPSKCWHSRYCCHSELIV